MMEKKSHNKSRVAILEVNLDELNQDVLGLEKFQRAYIVYKHQGVVVGQSWATIVGDFVPSTELRLSVSLFSFPVWKAIFSEMSVLDQDLPEASVVVCTRDRTAELANLIPGLSHLARMGHEVIIIDNCPSDDSTAQLASNYPDIRYVYEPNPGLDSARNRGLLTASGEIVAFIDDDAIPDENWLPALLKNFEDPTVGIVTGITLPMELETPAQLWFEETNSFGRGFEKKRFDGMVTSVIGTGQVGAGVNMAIRKSIVTEIGLFDEALDGGTLTLSGGDQEFFYRVLAHGFRIVYDPAALVWHKHRREWGELRKTLYGYGVGLYAWWTKALIVEREYTVLFWGLRWFSSHIMGNLARSIIKGSDHYPLDLAWAEFRGALIGWLRYLQSRRQTGQSKDLQAGMNNQINTENRMEPLGIHQENRLSDSTFEQPLEVE
jgi:GT2 family glycosyltransferase